MKTVADYLDTIPQSVVDSFMEDYGVNGWDLLMSSSVAEAEELLEQYIGQQSISDIPRREELYPPFFYFK